MTYRDFYYILNLIMTSVGRAQSTSPSLARSLCAARLHCLMRPPNRPFDTCFG